MSFSVKVLVMSMYIECLVKMYKDLETLLDRRLTLDGFLTFKIVLPTKSMSSF